MKLIGAWRNWNGEFATDQDGSPLGYSVVNGFQDFTYRTAEVQVSGRAIDRLDWTVGAFYYHGNSQSTQSVELPAFMGPRLPLYINDPTGVTNGLPNSLLVNGLDVGTYENTSGFIHGVYALTDQLHVTLGARYSDDKKHDDFDNTVFATPVDSNATRFDWRAGLDYQLTPGLMTYGSISTGYRPPAYNPRPFQQTQFVPVEGENMTAYEIGMKSDLFDRKLRVNVAGFYSDYKQRIVPAGGIECLKNPDGSVVPGATPNPEGGAACLALIPKTNYVNSPGEIKGGELELDFRPIDGLTISGSAGYTSFSRRERGPGRHHVQRSARVRAGVEWCGLDRVHHQPRQWRHDLAALRRLPADADLLSGDHADLVLGWLHAPQRARRVGLAGQDVDHRGGHQQSHGQGIPAQHLRPHALRRGDDRRAARRAARVVRDVPT